MKNFDLYKIIKKLNGEIRPSGNSALDGGRLKNINELFEVLNYIFLDLIDIQCLDSDRHEASVKEIVSANAKFFEEWLPTLNEAFKKD